jgi:hypothetical protein
VVFQFIREVRLDGALTPRAFTRRTVSGFITLTFPFPLNFALTGAV